MSKERIKRTQTRRKARKPFFDRFLLSYPTSFDTLSPDSEFLHRSLNLYCKFYCKQFHDIGTVIGTFLGTFFGTSFGTLGGEIGTKKFFRIIA